MHPMFRKVEKNVIHTFLSAADRIVQRWLAYIQHLELLVAYMLQADVIQQGAQTQPDKTWQSSYCQAIMPAAHTFSKYFSFTQPKVV